MKHLFMFLFLIIYSYKQHTYIHTHTHKFIQASILLCSTPYWAVWDCSTRKHVYQERREEQYSLQENPLFSKRLSDKNADNSLKVFSFPDRATEYFSHNIAPKLFPFHHLDYLFTSMDTAQHNFKYLLHELINIWWIVKFP